MRVLLSVLQLLLIFFNWHTAKIAAEPELGLLEVAPQPLEVLVDLVSQFPGVAGDDAGVRVVLTIFAGDQLVEDGDDEDCSFSHPRLCLAQNVLALQGVRNSVDLNFARMFEPTLSDPPFELFDQEKLIPACKVGTKLPLPISFLRLDLRLFTVIVVVVRDVH